MLASRSVWTAPRTHRVMISPASGTRPAISEGVRRMPAPIMPPMATAMPKERPSTRSRCPRPLAGESVADISFTSAQARPGDVAPFGLCLAIAPRRPVQIFQDLPEQGASLVAAAEPVEQLSVAGARLLAGKIGHQPRIFGGCFVILALQLERTRIDEVRLL